MAEKREIKFNTSMTSDRRNVDFAYLRKNVFDSKTKGLYPSADFTQEYPMNIDSSDDIEDILGSEESAGGGLSYDIKVITDDGTNLHFYNLGSDVESNTSLSSVNYECGAFGNDGVHICVDGDKLYKLQHSNSNTTAIGVTTGAFPDIAGFDGLYYWWLSQNEIYKQIGSNNPTLAFNDIGVTPRFVDFLNDQMVIFYEISGGVGVLFWDKSDTDLFDKRIFIPNCKLIAGGVVNGRLMLVTGVGNSANVKEQNGEIVVSGFDGEKFVRLNSIRAGQRDAQYVTAKGVGIGATIMAFSVDDNTNDAQEDLFQNYIYKVKSDGSIEVLWLPEEDVYGSAHIVRVFYNFILFATAGSGAISPRIYTNESFGSDQNDYRDYKEETVYITNFLNEPYNRHKLEGLAVAFEKLYTNDDSDPTLSSGTLNAESILYDSFLLSWTAASDDWQEPEDLEYIVYRSLANNISTYDDAVANGTLVQDWTADITELQVTGLTASTAYYFNVFVRDAGGNVKAYTPKQVTTPVFALVTEWRSPASNGSYYPAGDAASIQAWTNPGNVAASDDTYATVGQGNSGARTKWHNFGFSIPGGATILGIETKINGKYTNNPSGNELKLTARIFKDVVVDGAAGYGISGKSHPLSGGLTDSDDSYVRGGQGDLWGTTWTPAEINAANFGFSITGSTSSSPTATDYAIDSFQVRIIYTT